MMNKWIYNNVQRKCCVQEPEKNLNNSSTKQLELERATALMGETLHRTNTPQSYALWLQNVKRFKESEYLRHYSGSDKNPYSCNVYSTIQAVTKKYRKNKYSYIRRMTHQSGCQHQMTGMSNFLELSFVEPKCAGSRGWRLQTRNLVENPEGIEMFASSLPIRKQKFTTTTKKVNSYSGRFLITIENKDKKNK